MLWGVEISSKRIGQLFLAAGVMFCIGCASPGYLGDRARDGADVFTATVGLGGGVKARVGPIQVGGLVNIDMHGLRGGHFGEVGWYETDAIDVVIPFPFRTDSYTPKLYPWEYPARCFGQERWQASGASPKARLRDRLQCRKSYEAVSPIPFVSLASSASYYTQIDVVIAVFGSLRLGVNPGELVDFVLGWTTLDIYGDDVEIVGDARGIP